MKTYYIWFIGAVILLPVCIFFIPLSIYILNEVEFSLIIGGICAIPIVVGLLEIIRIEDSHPVDYRDIWKIIKMFVVITFIMGIIILFSLSARLNNNLKNKGIYTSATIIDKKYKTQGSSRNLEEIFNLTVKFIDAKGKKHSYEIEVEKDLYNAVSENSEADVKYLPSAPRVFKIIAGDKNVQTFKNLPNRNLEYTDVIRLMYLSTPETMHYLNKISSGWQTIENNNDTIFLNNLKKESIHKNGYDTILFKCDLINPYFIPRNIKEILKSSMRTEGTFINTRIYDFDSLTITVKRSISPDFAVKQEYLFERKSK